MLSTAQSLSLLRCAGDTRQSAACFWRSVCTGTLALALCDPTQSAAPALGLGFLTRPAASGYELCRLSRELSPTVARSESGFLRIWHPADARQTYLTEILEATALCDSFRVVAPLASRTPTRGAVHTRPQRLKDQDTDDETRPRPLGSEVAVGARFLGAGGGARTWNLARAVPPATRRLPCATFSQGIREEGRWGVVSSPMFALGSNFGDVKEGRSLRFRTVTSVAGQSSGAPSTCIHAARCVRGRGRGRGPPASPQTHPGHGARCSGCCPLTLN